MTTDLNVSADHSLHSSRCPERKRQQNDRKNILRRLDLVVAATQAPSGRGQVSLDLDRLEDLLTKAETWLASEYVMDLATADDETLTEGNGSTVTYVNPCVLDLEEAFEVARAEILHDVRQGLLSADAADFDALSGLMGFDRYYEIMQLATARNGGSVGCEAHPTFEGSVSDGVAWSRFSDALCDVLRVWITTGGLRRDAAH